MLVAIERFLIEIIRIARKIPDAANIFSMGQRAADQPVLGLPRAWCIGVLDVHIVTIGHCQRPNLLIVRASRPIWLNNPLQMVKIPRVIPPFARAKIS